MHIPENYLSPSTCAVMGAAMLPLWYLAAARVKKAVPREKLPLLGVGAAFAFLAMMFNIPLPGGTTGHAVGGTLLAVLLGPWAALLSISAALFVQALFFGDGGILSFGANCFNMAFALPFAGYAVYRAVRNVLPRHDVFAAGVGAYVGINVAAFLAGVEFGIQPLLFHDAAGQALYAPYPLVVALPAMMLGHLTLFGAAEVVFTTAVLAYLKKAAPSLAAGWQGDSVSAGAAQETVTGAALRKAGGTRRAIYGLLALLIVLTPLGLLAEGTAWGEWGADEIAETADFGSALGYVPAGISGGFSLDVLFPDYAIAGVPEAAGYVLAAVIGTALLVIAFKLAASLGRKRAGAC